MNMRPKLIWKFALVILLIALVVAQNYVLAADTKKAAHAKIYDKKADGFKQIAAALEITRKNGKRVLLDFGYDECGWCQRLHTMFEHDKIISERLKSDYVVVYIDWARGGPQWAGHNVEVDAKYQARTLYGAPSLVVLDSDGTRLTTKDTAELEEGDHHSPEKVLAFLKEWSKKK